MVHRLARTHCKPKQGMLLTIDDQEYRLGGRIGDGAVGVVRKAFRIDNKSPCAIKFLAPDPKYIDESVFDDVASRFRREGIRGAQLEHPHLVEIYAYVQNDNSESFRVDGPANPFICMEWVKGQSLESYIRKIPQAERGLFMPDRERLQIAIQIATALEYLHKNKIVHRDVKPANIFLTRHNDLVTPLHAKLGDFGIVKWNDYHNTIPTGTLTVTNQQGLGTLKYMAPEQALDPKSVGVRTDIFSFGITLFELFTGSIMPSYHHVFNIMSARLVRNITTTGRYLNIGYNLPFEFTDLGELLLDMHLRGASGRPAVAKVLGNLKYQYYCMFNEEAPIY